MRVQTFFTPLTGAAALFASTAMADVTAQQVWDDWKANMGLYGENGITIGSETAGPGTVTVTDLAVAFNDGEVAVNGTLPSLVFTENGDGTVSVTMSEEYPIVISPANPSDQPGSGATVLIRQSGATTTVSGTPDAITYDLVAQRYAIELTELMDAGEVIPMTAFFALNSVTGTYTSRPGDIRQMDYAFSAATVDALLDVNVPGEAVINIAGQIANVALNARMAIPAQLLANINPDAPDLTGLAISGGYSFDGSAYTANIDADGEQIQATITSSSGNLDFAFSEAGASYDTMLRDLTVSAPVVPEFPLPINVSIAEYGIGFEMPLSRTDAPAPVRASITLTDLSLNEELWSMADPMGQFSHDPITAQVALSGQMKWLFDLLDPTQQAALNASAMPAEIHALNIDALNILALGASVTGSGAFTFDNADLTTIPGVPRPQGQASIVVTGANAIMDKLVASGMIPEAEMMGPRMMLGMFATATGDDQLTSNIEVRPDGSVFVNGQQVM